MRDLEEDDPAYLESDPAITPDTPRESRIARLRRMRPVSTNPRVPIEVRFEQVTAVLEMMENGDFEGAACEKVGISRATFRNWALKVAAQEHYAKALEAIALSQIEKAETVLEDMYDGTIPPEQARIGMQWYQWTAGRLFPKTWGDKQQLEHSGNVTLGAALDALDV